MLETHTNGRSQPEAEHPCRGRLSLKIKKKGLKLTWKVSHQCLCRNSCWLGTAVFSVDEERLVTVRHISSLKPLKVQQTKAVGTVSDAIKIYWLDVFKDAVSTWSTDQQLRSSSPCGCHSDGFSSHDCYSSHLDYSTEVNTPWAEVLWLNLSDMTLWMSHPFVSRSSDAQRAAACLSFHHGSPQLEEDK